MTYEEYVEKESALTMALASLQQQYIKANGLAVGTRVRCNGQLGYVESIGISANGELRHSIIAANKDGSMPKTGKYLGFWVAIEDLELA